MIVPRYVIGFAGHRRLPDVEAVRRGLKSVLEDLKHKTAAVGGRLEIFASAAAGADTLALEVARELGLAVHVILPLPEEEFKKDFSDESGSVNEAEWRRAAAQLALARENHGTDSVRLLPSRAPRPECYYETGLSIIDACDLMITVWDGEPARGLGGTGQFHRLAMERGRPLISLNPATGRINFQENLPEVWPERDSVIDGLNRSLAAGTEKEESLTATDLFRRLEATANTKAPEFRRGAARIIWINAAATLAGASGAMFSAWLATFLGREAQRIPPMIFNGVELLLVLGALLIVIWLKGRKVRDRWMQSRFATELLRSIRASSGWLDPLHPNVAVSAPQWRRFALTAGLVCSGEVPAAATLDERKRAYFEQRLAGQIRHFQEKGAPAGRYNDRYEALTVLATWLSPLFVMLALFLRIRHPEWSAGTFWGSFTTKFLPVVLPLSAGTAAALRSTMDHSRRSRRYPALAQRLEGLARGFTDLQTEHTARDVVARTEDILLDELLNWQLASRSAGIR